MAMLTVPAGPPVALAGPWTSSRKRWTVDEFHALYGLPAFEGKKLVLLAGEILEMPNPNAPHDAGLGLAGAAVAAAFGPGFWVRGQMALRLGQFTDPMPDLAVVPGSPRDYAQQPTTALLVVEVSDTSLAIDTGVKAQLYAAAGIADYWVVDLNNRALVVHRDPQPDPASPSGSSYRTVTALSPGQAISPLSAPTASVRVDDLLP